MNYDGRNIANCVIVWVLCWQKSIVFEIEYMDDVDVAS